MKRKYLITFIIFLLAAIILILVKNNPKMKSTISTVREEDGYYISDYGKVSIEEWGKIDLTKTRFEYVEDFLKEVDYYVKTISKYIDKEDWIEPYKEMHGDDFKFIINFKFGYGGSHVFGSYDSFEHLIPEVTLNLEHFEMDSAPIAHEITHLIAPLYSTLSLREGLASLVQDEIGKNPAVFNFGEPIIPLTKEYLTYNNFDMNEILDEKKIIKYNNAEIKGMESRRTFYILSYSFSKYLVDEYGIEKFMEIYDAEDSYSKWMEVYGKSLEELQNNWIDYVMEYEE